MNFYKRFMGDYGRDTADLSMMEHGAYNVILDTYYATGGPLAPDMPSLYRIAKAFSAAERKAVEKVVERFFKIGPDGLRHNKRADEEITGHLEQSEANRAVAVAREAKRRGHESLDESTTNRATDGSTIGSTKTALIHSHSQKKNKASAFAPPDWVPLDAWNAYVEMRIKVRKPMTDYAKSLAVRTLAELANQGCDPIAVLENSVQNSWLGLFAVKKKINGEKRVAL